MPGLETAARTAGGDDGELDVEADLPPHHWTRRPCLELAFGARVRERQTRRQALEAVVGSGARPGWASALNRPAERIFLPLPSANGGRQAKGYLKIQFPHSSVAPAPKLQKT